MNITEVFLPKIPQFISSKTCKTKVWRYQKG